MRRTINKLIRPIYQVGLIISVVVGIGLTAGGCSHPISSVPTLKILVEEEGIYRISADRLASEGMDIRDTAADQLQLSLRGEEQYLYVFTNDGGMWIEFYGQKSDSLYSGENIYILDSIDHKSDFTELIEGEIKEIPALAGLENSVYLETLHLEENNLYFPQVEGSEHWYWAAVTNGQQQRITFDLSEVAPGEGSIRVNLWSNTEAPEEPDHHLRLKVNNQLILDESWDGKGGRQITATIPAALYVEGENSVEVEISGDTGSAAEVSWIDWYEVSYPRYAIAEQEQLKFKLENQALILSGFHDSIHIFEITDQNGVIFQGEADAGGESVMFTGVEGHTYYAVGEGGFQQPVSITSLAEIPTESVSREGADYLIIGPEVFLSEADELITHREAQGLRVMRVPLEGLFDQFAYGFPEPEAIRRFLIEATQNWEINPKYVLLLGDASYDPHNYLELTETNILPTYFVQTHYGGQTASDLPYADLDDDGMPDIAVGRIPASSAEEVAIFVSKTLDYEIGGSGQGAEFRLLAVADGQEVGFQYDAQRFLDIFSPDFERELFSPMAGTPDADQAIEAYFSDGYSLVAYFGHGSLVMWGKDQLFTTEDAEKLTNIYYPVVINMTCLTGLFTHPKTESLSETLLFNPSGGAIAIMAPTSLTLPGDQSFLSNPLGEALNDGAFERIGDIFLASQRQVNVTSQGVWEVLQTFLLFGDPGLVIFPKE